ncbi:hypothetical protein A3Q56_00910 [Intoshia linei]|uniref:RNA helicase n=1 Tax=Intoshia linei TaxID=1819745 RepID=A0A177BCT6_9BILA|nr:hypothetical protein A3Q56_00910 [Intoshia linei]
MKSNFIYAHFRRPYENEPILSYLKTIDMSSCTRDERDNAYFVMAEAVIQCINYIKNKHLVDQLNCICFNNPSRSNRLNSPVSHVHSASISTSSIDYKIGGLTFTETYPKPKNKECLNAIDLAINYLQNYNDLPYANKIEFYRFEEKINATSPMIINSDNESLTHFREQKTRGNLEWAPQRDQLIFSVMHKKKEYLMHERCPECGIVMKLALLKNYRYCNYYGKFFCRACHLNDTRTIPGYILAKWDFTKRTVSHCAQRYLDQIYDEPLFLSETLTSNKKLNLNTFLKADNIRKSFVFTVMYITSCKSASKLVDQLSSIPFHWYNNLDYSIHDFIIMSFFMSDKIGELQRGYCIYKIIYTGEFVKTIKKLLNDFFNHIHYCNVCIMKGFICEICENQKDIIFPFQISLVYTCKESDDSTEVYIPIRQRNGNVNKKLEIDLEPIEDYKDNIVISKGFIKNQEDVPLLKEYWETKQSDNEDESDQLKIDKQVEHEDRIMSTMVYNDAMLPEMDSNINNEKPLITRWWKPPIYRQNYSREQILKICDDYGIEIVGNNLITPLTDFYEMQFPYCILEELKSNDIRKPTNIQIITLPNVLSGRDVIATASTGSGKTLAFVLPAVMFSLEQEIALPFHSNEGPMALIICPSRELARQIFNVIENITKVLANVSYPQIKTLLCVGGSPMTDQISILSRGVHIVVATPGRLTAFIKSRQINMTLCQYVVLDEADRMIDTGFVEEIGTVFKSLPKKRQTILFSATMPKNIEEFALKTLINPLIIKTGRAGSATLRVVQNVEFVLPLDRYTKLLESFEKTKPPVLIFAEKKHEVDKIHQYLLIKSLRVAAIHGGKNQCERDKAIDDFRSKNMDILVATDVASKGLDFKLLNHIINFDMPKEIDIYVHRIGRAGRGKNKGLATTYVNHSCDHTVLLDLKHLLIEAKQKIPDFLIPLEASYISKLFVAGALGCSYCGGLGHRVMDCPKLESKRALKEKSITKGMFDSSGTTDW